jgi:hypothetical protein
MFKQFIFVFAVWNVCGLSSLAADFPPAYEATYTQVFGGKKSTVTAASDGKGKMKTKMIEASGIAMESVADYPAKSTTTVMYQEKMWAKTPIKEPYQDENALKKVGKSLGTKMFDGHLCNGYETKVGESVCQTWIGADTHEIVHFENVGGVAKNVMDLTSFSDKAGDVSLVIPKDCKEIGK